MLAAVQSVFWKAIKKREKAFIHSMKSDQMVSLWSLHMPEDPVALSIDGSAYDSS